MSKNIPLIFGNRVRVRVCGLCWQGDQLLVVNHHLEKDKDFWAPPGGGVDFGKTMEETLTNEFQEETGLTVKIDDFRFLVEFIKHPFHAIEVFYHVTLIAGNLKIGYDPEMPNRQQIIKGVAFLSGQEIMTKSSSEKHGIFSHITKLEDLKQLTGFYRI